MSLKAFICRSCASLIMGLGSAITTYEARAENENLKLNKDIIENSPVLRRWLVDPPDILYDIYNTPSFDSKIRLGLTSRDGSLGFDLGLVDLFLGKSAFTINANFQSEFSGRETDLNADLKYYVLPLGGYFNIAPLIGYRYIDFLGRSLSGVDVGIQGILILSPRSADLRLSQSFTAPLSDQETSITTLSSSFALSDRLSIASNIQWRRSSVRSDSRVGFLPRMAVMTLPIAVDTVAIDFGTTNTVVCILDPVTNIPKILKFSISRTISSTAVIPSLVFINEDGTCICGERVRSQRLGYAQPQRLFQGFKREMVAEFRASPMQIDGIIYTAEAIAQLFLQTVWQEILRQYQPKQVIFTAPVGAFESYRDWFRQLATSLELPVMQIIDESTAAALGYAIAGTSSLVLVIDFGGGTLDLSLVRTAKSDRHDISSSLKAEVIAKSDAYIGGIDIDIWIGAYFLTKLGITKSQIGNTGWLNLLEIAEKMKIQLSTLEQVTESWFDDENFIAYELKLSQADLGDILESRLLIEQVRQILDEVLAIAYSKGVSKLEIQQVLMVGGSSQIKAVQNLVISYFGKSRVRMDKPFEAIAIGALTLGQFEVIEDSLRHAYGIRLWDNFTKSHYYYTLFEKGIKYPCDRLEPLILQVANSAQTEIRLDIGELADHAEIELTYDSQGRMTSSKIQKHSDFRSLASNKTQNSSSQIALQSRSSFTCKLNPAAEMGIDRLEIRLGVNAQRVLIATVKDLLTQKILIEEQAIAQLD